jgi:hypothetical protein
LDSSLLEYVNKKRQLKRLRNLRSTRRKTCLSATF